MGKTSTLYNSNDRLIALASIGLSNHDSPAVLEQIADIAARLLPASLGASVILWNSAIESYTSAASRVSGQESTAPVSAIRNRADATRWIIDNAEQLVIEDAKRHPLGGGSLIQDHGVGAFIGMPIVADDRVLGVLYVFDSAARVYTDSEVAFLQILAQRAAQAIAHAADVERTRSESEAKRQALVRARDDRRRSDAIARVTNGLMDMSSPADQLRVVANGVCQAVDAERAFLSILNPDSRTIVHAVHGGLSAEAMEPASYSELMVGLSGWAITHHKTAVVGGPDAGDSAELQLERTGNHAGPVVVTPLRFSDETVGSLTVIRRVGEAAFSRAEVSTVELMASQTALALERSFLIEENRNLAHTDALTGLPNRRHLELMGIEAFEAAKRYQRPMSVLVIDVNDFKQVNDTLGHDGGDKELISIARACRSAARSADVIGRWGGDEFLAILPETDVAGSHHVATRIFGENGGSGITLAVGAATRLPADQDLAQLISRADAAMYRAKEINGNGYAR